MLIIANGDKFGKFMIPVVGIALFMRSGFVNLSYPVDSSLSMEIVDKELRPVLLRSSMLLQVLPVFYPDGLPVIFCLLLRRGTGQLII